MSAEKYSSGAVVEVFFLARHEVRGEKLARLEASGVLSSCILDLQDMPGHFWLRLGLWRGKMGCFAPGYARCAGRQGDIEGRGGRGSDQGVVACAVVCAVMRVVMFVF